ncbi:MAG TPA: S41 family peptidase [Holophagaceae bacterium]|nr:S41 family peptidase [Holophagaceae bacterium]
MAAWIKKHWMWVTVLGTAVVYVPLAGRGGEDAARLKTLDTLTEVMGLVQKDSPEPPTPKQMTHATIQGMLHTLDPHSNYFDETEFRLMREDQRGSFFGIGSIITQQEQGIAIISPIPGGPSERIGIRAGDLIKEIDGQSTEGWSSNQALEKLRGQKGTPVELGIQRPGVPDLLHFTIVRAEIPSNSVQYAFMLSPTTGYISIKDFGETTSDEFQAAIGRLKKQGMQSLVLDLRNNPGGLLDAAIGVCGQLLGPNQLIVTTKGRDEKDVQETRTPAGAPPETFPVVVLVNRGTASASEIVTGAIQDHDRGLVVGTTSWGKGLVQSVLPIGRTRGLALTTARYYTPSGRCIQRDYSHGLDDYYNPDDEPAQAPQGPVYKTDLGRTVYGGGGITPDVVAAPPKADSTMIDLRFRKSAFFRFAVTEKERAGFRPAEPVDEALLGRFKAWLAGQKIEVPESAWTADLADIKDQLAIELANVGSGLESGAKVGAEKDPVVQKAIDLMPQAEKLLQKQQLQLKLKVKDRADAVAEAEPRVAELLLA